jgi:carboxypeptidase C (cathepsin A)
MNGCLRGAALAVLLCGTALSGASLAAVAAPPEPAAAPLPDQVDPAVVTSHDVTVNGKVIHYKATAGSLILRNADGKPTASMFYVAYVADQPAGAPKRPVTFLFNGGPGSASLWLHMSGLGPRSVVTASPNPTGPAPYRFGASDNTLLDKTDLVFLDAIGTGYSQILPDGNSADFWGVDQDANAFTQAITTYLSQNQRWTSPKFLFGESYGTTRAAALVYRLQNVGVQVNGVVLLSTILDFAPGLPGQDQGFVNIMPTFAATAWYHNRAKREPADFNAFLDAAREFARGPYAAALSKGDALPEAEENAVAERLSQFTGLSVDYLKRCKLRIDMEAFRRELLKDQTTITGRFDARFTARDSYLAASGSFDPATDDPATGGVSSAYLSTFHDYLSGELNYHPDRAYKALNNMVVEPAWNWSHKAPGFDEPLTTTNTAIDLSAAMRGNPQLKVLSMNGLYDLSTPFFATENALQHMLLTPELRGNVKLTYYSSGHMTYGDQTALKQMKTDLDAFYDTATH